MADWLEAGRLLAAAVLQTGAAPLLSNRIECYIPRLLGVLFLLLKDIVTDSIALDILKVFTRVQWSERRKLEILR